MNKLILFLMLFLSTASFGQTLKPLSLRNPSAPDTSFRVVRKAKKSFQQPFAFFVNGKLLSINLLQFHLDKIKDIKEIKKDTMVNGILYHQQTHLTINSDYYNSLKTITLNNLKDKYTHFKDKPVLFLIDGQMINESYDTYMVAENLLLNLEISTLKTGKDGIEIGVITILTKTTENIKKRDQNQIRIRGNSLAAFR